ncbi:hypothetical protein BaRGS_00016150 [Batillaria attramentaria]|uniref:Uncharacterized protein n=1 Tax=Batillaria attramentaria TaxID=370345 RepID=A0ABD0KZK5_9CAEN
MPVKRACLMKQETTRTSEIISTKRRAPTRDATNPLPATTTIEDIVRAREEFVARYRSSCCWVKETISRFSSPGMAGDCLLISSLHLPTSQPAYCN